MPDPIVTSPNPADAAGADNLDANGNPIIPAEPQIDWEAEDNPYRKRYADSQGQIQPLVRVLQQFAEYDHNTKTWKPKTAPVSPPLVVDEDFEKVLEGYDPDFRKALQGYTQKQIKDAIAEFKKESAFLSDYNSTMLSNRSKAMEEFGDEFEFAKYAIFNPDGTFARYSSAEAEYMATVEAYAILSKRAKQPPQDKGKLSAIKGQTTGSAAVKKQLTYDEYNKLSDAEKDVYDAAQLGG